MKRIFMLFLILLCLLPFNGVASQHDMDVSVGDANTGVDVRAGFNAAIQALASTSTGPTAPTTTYAHQFWADETNDLLKMRNEANDAWIIIGALNESGNTFEVSAAAPMKTVSSYPYTITTADNLLIFTGTGTVTFPQQSAVSASTVKEEFILVNIGTGVVTLAPFAGDSLPETTLRGNESITYVGNGGTAWINENARSEHAPGYAQRPKFIYTEALDYDGGTVLFVVGEVVTGAGAATGTIVALTGDATSGTFYLNTRNATAYVNNETLTGDIAGDADADGISTKDSIVLKANSKKAARYNHNGTKEQTVYWETDIPYEFSALGASDWIYLYLDDSAIVTAATNVITVTELVDSATGPDEYTGYNGSDKAIFAIRTDAGSDIYEFFHNDDFVLLADELATNISNTNLADGTWTDVQVGAGDARLCPTFTAGANIMFKFVLGTTPETLQWRTNGQLSTNGHNTLSVVSATEVGNNEIRTITDSSGLIEVTDGTGDSVTTVWVGGWYFPEGM